MRLLDYPIQEPVLDYVFEGVFAAQQHGLISSVRKGPGTGKTEPPFRPPFNPCSLEVCFDPSIRWT
jgi:hypothetical protein